MNPYGYVAKRAPAPPDQELADITDIPDFFADVNHKNRSFQVMVGAVASSDFVAPTLAARPR